MDRRVCEAGVAVLLVNDYDSFFHVAEHVLVSSAKQLRINVGKTDPRVKNVHHCLTEQSKECVPDSCAYFLLLGLHEQVWNAKPDVKLRN